MKINHKEQLVELENGVREEETNKFNSILYSLEQRMKSVEDAREALARKNQELSKDLSNSEKRASE